MKAVVLLLIIPLISLALAVPTYAYEDIDINITTTPFTPFVYGIDCTNITGTIYCYMATQSSGHYYIERFNETLQDRKYCEWNSIGLTPQGLFIVNDSFSELLKY